MEQVAEESYLFFTEEVNSRSCTLEVISVKKTDRSDQFELEVG